MKFYHYSLNMKKLNTLCFLFFIPLFFLIYILNYFKYIDITFIVLYFLCMFLHEFVHGLGFSLSKDVEHKNIVYGACLEKGIFYCMCKQMISKKDIIVSLLFPFFLIGIFTFFLGIIINSPILVLLSLFNIVGCVGDLAMFFSFIKLPDFSYVDVDDCTGFYLISKNNLSNYKLFGVDLCESGDSKDLVFSTNFRKITSSKLSLVIFIFLILTLVLDLIM